MQFSYLLTTLSTLTALAAAGSGGTPKYPACPTLKKTYASCGEPSNAYGGLTSFACDQLTANNKCNSNTNIYSTARCFTGTGAPTNKFYCQASIINSIDMTTWTSYCQKAQKVLNNQWVANPYGSNALGACPGN